jgi:phage I-like protein
MKYYSEELKKFYDSAEECSDAEKKFEEEMFAAETKRKALAEKRSARAEEVEQAYAALSDARKTYYDKLNEFVKDYGSFHMSIKGVDEDPFQFFTEFFKF